MTTRRSPYEYSGNRRAEDGEDRLQPSASAAAASAVGSLFGRALGGSAGTSGPAAGSNGRHPPPSAAGDHPHRHPYSAGSANMVSSDAYGSSDALSVQSSSLYSSSDPLASSHPLPGAAGNDQQPPLPHSSNPLTFVASLPRRILRLAGADPYDDDDDDYENGDDVDNDYVIGTSSGRDPAAKRRSLLRVLLATGLLVAALAYRRSSARKAASNSEIDRPDFVYEHPYVTSSYYTSTKSLKTLLDTDRIQVQPNKVRHARRLAAGEEEVLKRTRLAVVRPFCEFDAGALPTTFTCWNSLSPCKAGSRDLGDIDDPTNSTNDHDESRYFDNVGSDIFKDATTDLFLFYSQTFSENDEAIHSVDQIIDEFNSPGGWSQCFENIYAIEANIPQELDLYIPSAQEELYNWVNGPNRQFEAAFRIIQSGEWGDYDGFYLMEGDSIPIKSHWLDVVLSEVEVHRPFAILGA